MSEKFRNRIKRVDMNVCLHHRLMASTAHRVSLGFSLQLGDDPDEISI